MTQERIVQIELDDFMKAMKKLENKEWPDAVATAFSEIAVSSREKTKNYTAIKFTLRSNWVLQGIKALPETESQKSAAAASLRKTGELTAAVYMRGASQPQNDLTFMGDHAYGRGRSPHGKNQSIALPMPELADKSNFRTSRGAVAKKWKPGALLNHFNMFGIYKGGTTQPKSRKKKGPRSKKGYSQPFLIKSSKQPGPLIVRRRSTNKWDLEVLYSFNSSVKIKKGYEFEQNVWHGVKMSYARALNKCVSTLKIKP